MFESIGQRLKKERVARFLTLEQASEATRIRIVFLQALESDDYSVMPSAAQGRGFLRNYAGYLELNIDEMIADIQNNASQAEVISGPLPQVNLAETEIPPLPSELDEKPTRPSRASRLGRRPKADAASATESTESVPANAIPQVEGEQPKARGRKKKPVVEKVAEIKVEELILPIEQDQTRPEQGRRAEVKQDAKPGLITRLVTSFLSRFIKKDIQAEFEMPAVIESEIPRSVPLQPADVIFVEIGAQLRERRELISLTIDEVERHTKLRAAFVKALEDGAFDKLPSPVQTRGMLANYATFLDLDTDAILLRFADGLQARRYEKYAETPRDKIQTEVITSMPFLRGYIAGDLIFGVVMIASLFALAIWGVGRVVNLQNKQNAEATARPIVDVLGGTPLPTASLEVTFVPVDENALVTPGAEITANPELNANVVVSIFAVERVFVRISVDGEVAFEGRLAPGETKVFEANDQVMVLTGNAAALRITYNGRDLGLMGNIGEVVSRVYLITGVAIPTPTISPTPTLIPEFTPTATPPDGG